MFAKCIVLVCGLFALQLGIKEVRERERKENKAEKSNEGKEEDRKKIEKRKVKGKFL